MSDKLDFSAWNESLGRVISNIDRPTVLAEMLGGIGERVPFDLWYVAYYRRDAPPLEIDYSYASYSREEYAEGPYLLCPFYNAFLDGLEAGCYSLKQFAPPDFKTSEYYLGYYAPWGEASEVAFILPVDDNTAGHVSLSRTGRTARFSPTEMRFLNQVTPVVQAVIDRIWQRTRLEAQDNEQFGMDFHVRMTQAFRKFGTAYLTGRESEITHLLLRGHSAKSVARLLKISPGTVRNHMKSIYIKLEISSQSELFGLFFESLSHLGTDITSDPLKNLRVPVR